MSPHSVFSVRMGHLRRCGHRLLGVLRVVCLCGRVGRRPRVSFCPEAFVFKTGTTTKCLHTGRAVGLVGSMTSIMGGSEDVGKGLGIMFVRSCEMSGTRVLFTTTSIDRRVSATSGRTSNANGVGFVLGNTPALKAVSKTGMRVIRRIKRRGTFVFNLDSRRMVGCRGGNNCGPASICFGS